MRCPDWLRMKTVLHREKQCRAVLPARAMCSASFLCYSTGVYSLLLHLLSPLVVLTMHAAPSQGVHCTCAITIGATGSFGDEAGKLITFLATSISALTAVLFLIGVLMLVASGVHEEYRQKGKDLMIGSLIAMAVVLGAYAILRMVQFLIQ